MEEQIDKTKKDNLELIKKVRNLKNVQVTNSKELEICNINKKYPTQINIFTEEIKNQVAKKHEYYNKLVHNKKSLSNMKTLLKRTVKSYNEIAEAVKNDKSNDNIVKVIEETIGVLTEELTGADDDILDKVCLGSNHLNTNPNNEENKLKRKKTAPKLTRAENAKSPKSKTTILPNIYQQPQPHIQRGPSPGTGNNPEYKGIFNKYEYLSSRGRNSVPHYMIVAPSKSQSRLKNSQKGLIKNKEKISNPVKSDDEEDLEILNLDYDNTHDVDYANLIKKREQLNKVNEVLSKNIRELDKLQDKKAKDLKNTLEHNTKKLKMLQQVKLS